MGNGTERYDRLQDGDSDELLREIAERFGTPTYVYDLAAIRERAARLRRAFPSADLCYAVKANPCAPVLRELAGAGLGAEVITVGELERARRAGVLHSRLLVGGPGQDEALIRRAVELRVGHVSLDSSSQWELWREALRNGTAAATSFLVRINPQLDPQTHPHLATGAAGSKFGMPLGEASELAGQLAREGVLGGFHFHIGSQIRSLTGYQGVADLADQAFAAHPQANTLDLGGGFAVPDFPLEEFAALASGLARRLDVRLILEPGRYLVAEAGVLLTTVRHVKAGSPRHVIADAGMADLLRPALYSARHPLRRLGDPPLPAGSESAADVDGPLCENADRLLADARLPSDLRRGDRLVVEQAGAYGMSMASNYASSLRPAEVVIDGSAARLARARETVEDLLRLEVQ